jgi:hypothetical protein
MTLSPEERIEREFRLKVGNELRGLLERVESLRPLRCVEHDQPLATCDDEGEDCTVDGAEPYDFAILGDFAVIVDWQIPGKTMVDDEAVGMAFWAPGMTRSRRLGLLEVTHEAQ